MNIWLITVGYFSIGNAQDTTYNASPAQKCNISKQLIKSEKFTKNIMNFNDKLSEYLR